MSYTPGPWHLKDDGRIAEPHGNEIVDFIRFHDDARLIAAAPEMAELLESYWKEDGQLSDHARETRDEATRTLLSHVRGENE